MFNRKITDTQAADAVEKLKEQIYIDVYNKVAKKIIDESLKKQIEINNELMERLEGWNVLVKESIDNQVKERLDKEKDV